MNILKVKCQCCQSFNISFTGYFYNDCGGPKGFIVLHWISVLHNQIFTENKVNFFKGIFIWQHILKSLSGVNSYEMIFKKF